MQSKTELIVSDNDEESKDISLLNGRLVVAALHNQEIAEAATKAEHRLRDLLQGLDAVICEVGVLTGKPQFLSLKGDTLLGFPIEYWNYQFNFLLAIVHPSDRDRTKSVVDKFLAEDKDFEYEFRAISSEDETVWMRNIVKLVRNFDDTVTLMRCVIIDVTSQKIIAERLETSYARERYITETLQCSMLYSPGENSFPGIAVRSFYEASSEEVSVGGDFSDIFACDHGNVALVLGDVMGHGLPAAIFTAELKYTLRGFIREHIRPGRIMQQMNNCLCESGRLFAEGLNQAGDDAPVCLTIVIINASTGRGAVATAGMERPMVLRQDGTSDVLN